MSVALYMDVHIPAAVSNALIELGVDVLTAQMDGTSTLEDPLLLNRATELGRTLFTQDKGFIQEAALRQRAGIRFAGIIFAHQVDVTVGRMVRDLSVIGLAGEPEDLENRLERLPL